MSYPAWLPREWLDAPRTNQRPTPVTLTASGTAHTKGAYSEVIAATSGPGYWIIISALNTTVASTDTSQLLDVAIGAAASEEIIFPDIQTGWTTDYTRAGGGLGFWSIPFYVPSGARLSARIQAAVISDLCEISIDILGGSPISGYFSACTSYGENASDSRGTQITTGDPVDTKGSWVELEASTPAPIDAFMLGVSSDGNLGADRNYLIDIGVGAGGSEIVVVSDIHFESESQEFFQTLSPRLHPLAVSLPAGVRLSARDAGSTINDNTVYVGIHGLRL